MKNNLLRKAIAITMTLGMLVGSVSGHVTPVLATGEGDAIVTEAAQEETTTAAEEETTTAAAEEETTTETAKEEEGRTGIVSADGDGLSLRSGPDASNDVLDLIPDGTELVITEEQDGWGHVTYNGTEGWVSLDYVE